MWGAMKMKIEIRNDTAVVSGYVNAVGRDSRPITDVRGKFVEQIEPGAFRASLERSENVDLLLNHDKSNVYASTRDGSLKLTEDSIGLRAEAVLTDAEMIRKARSGEFRGWSFGMYVGDSAMEERAEGIPRRHVKSLNMFEVSLIDKSRIPCYVGTSVECRADSEDVLAELRYSEEEPEIVEEERSEPEPVDYSAVDDVISELRYGALDNVIAELRYNPYHDPSTGRFCSGGGGGGGGVLVVEKGQKGKGFYVVPSEKFEDGDSNAKYNGFSVTYDDGTTIHFTSKNGIVGFPTAGGNDMINSSQLEVMQMALDKYGDTQTMIDKINQSGIGKAAKLSDKSVEKMQADYSKYLASKPDYELGNAFNEHGWAAAHKKSVYRPRVNRSFDPVDSVIEELRYNPYHDPSNGRFCSGGGSGGGRCVGG